VHQSYFKEDRKRFAVPGSHNLHRARGQLAVARSVHQQRTEAESFVMAR
jgi:hypothetical protein